MHWMPSPEVRRWMYGVLTAGVPLLIAYGVIEQAVAPLWIALAGSLLGTGMAALNVPKGGNDE
jgi:hypothetical protein